MELQVSINANNGVMRMFVNFDVKSNPNTDHVLTVIRQNQAQSQFPLSEDVRNYGFTIQKSRSSRVDPYLPSPRLMGPTMAISSPTTPSSTS